MIVYTHSTAGVTAADLRGFFVGWPAPPDPATHLRILDGSTHVVLARDGADGPIVGFVTAVGDGVLTAYVPLLEVLPSHRGRGIGTALVQRLLETTADLYAVDVICDDDVRPFYERFGMRAVTGMVHRNYAAQSGRPG